MQTNVPNEGDQAGSCKVVLKLNGTEVESKELTLASAKTETVSFQIKVGQPEDYTLGVNDKISKFVVIAPVMTSVSPPTTTPPAAFILTSVPQNVPSPLASITSSPGSKPSANVNWLIWIAPAAGIIVVAMLSVITFSCKPGSS